MILYEWDEEKRHANLQKRRLDFLDAGELMESPDALRFHARSVNGELRLGAIGEVDGEVLHLVYTMRENRVRCISFRKAKRKERKRYYASLQQRRTEENA